jgi:hypothetical protein
VKTNGEPETAIKSNDEPETGSNVEIEVAKNVPSEIENAIKSNEESETVIGKGMLREESSTDFTSSLKN